MAEGVPGAAVVRAVVTNPVGVLLLLGAAAVGGLLVGAVVYRHRETPDRLAMADALQAAATETADSVPGPAARQRAAVTAEALTEETRAARVGDEWTTTLALTAFPDYPSDGYLSELFTRTDVAFDLTARVSPKEQERARQQLQDTADDLQVDAEMEASARGAYLQDRATEAVGTYEAVEDGTSVFEQAVYVTVRAADRETLRDAVQAVRRTLRDDPANCTPKVAVCRQQDALRAAAPVGPDPLDRTSIALGGAVGALLASARSPTLLEPDGIEVGEHKDTRSPLVVDPFGRENGYATFTVGDPGTGKSFGAKQRFIRAVTAQPDRLGIILEPLNDWVGVAEALDAERITVGGDCGLNPLEIRPTPDHVQQAMGTDASPFNERLDSVLSFLTNFFATRGVDLGDRRPTLETALVEAYHRQGITADVATHDNESPTLRDVLDVLEDVVDTPSEFAVRSDAEAQKLREDATWLLDQLRVFEGGGRYANLGRQTEADFHDADVIYLDLAQQEGRVDDGTALTMQLLISLVYQRIKATDKETIFTIDEARYLMEHAASLSFLETVFRHHRHHDLSIRLVTQTVDEFFQHPESEMIGCV